jgi:hypothetical protein
VTTSYFGRNHERFSQLGNCCSRQGNGRGQPGNGLDQHSNDEAYLDPGNGERLCPRRLHNLLSKGPRREIKDESTLVKNDLLASANVHLCHNLMDCQTQSIWLRFGPTSSKYSSSTLGAFALFEVYRTWSDQNGRIYNAQKATKLLGSLCTRIASAAERYARVVVHGDMNLNLDRAEDTTYAQKRLLKSLAECTEAAGLETHITPQTYRSHGLHLAGCSQPRGGDSRPGDGRDQFVNGRDPPGEGGSQPEDGARHSYVARLDHVYTRGSPSRRPE